MDVLYVCKFRDKHSMCDGKLGVFGNALETAIRTVGVHTIGVGPSGVFLCSKGWGGHNLGACGLITAILFCALMVTTHREW